VGDVLDLLRLEIETLWVLGDDGRLVRNRTDDGRPVPLLAIGACHEGLCWTVGRDVPDDIAVALTATLEATAAGDEVGWRPDSERELLDRLSAFRPLGPAWLGPSYVVPAPLPAPRGLDLRSSATDDVAGLRGLMPEKDRRILIEPWVVAMVDGQVAAVCETSRSAPTSVEAGVWTYEPYRRRGLGAAVTAAWSGYVVDRTAFYSTNWDNVGSQGIARRLGLHPLGQLWHVCPA
jgi:hypothetical protein